MRGQLCIDLCVLSRRGENCGSGGGGGEGGGAGGGGEGEGLGVI